MGNIRKGHLMKFRNKSCLMLMVVLLVACQTSFGKDDSSQVENSYWRLAIMCPTTVTKSSSQTCAVLENARVFLRGLVDGKVADRKVEHGSTVTVNLAIMDKDFMSRDDVVASKRYTFKGGETVEIMWESFCGDLKKDIGNTSEIYVKIDMRWNPGGVNIPFGGKIFGSKLSTKSRPIKVKIVKK